MSSYTSSPRPDNDDDLEDLYSSEGDGNDSDEDTEDASETEDKQQNNLQQRTEIKEQMYQDKLAHLKRQLQHLKEGTLPEYIKRNKKIEQQYRERLRMNEIWRDLEAYGSVKIHWKWSHKDLHTTTILEIVEREHRKEKKASAKEFEEKKIELKESLIMELEEKKRNVESERGTMDMNTACSGSSRGNTSISCMTDFMEVKPIMTRKLRRRPNDPVPIPEKRRKPSPAQLNFFLEEQEIMDDLRIINKVSGKPINKKPAPPPTPIEGVSDVKIDDGKLYYDKRWFHRNQPVFVESKEGGKVCGVITGVGSQEIWVRKTSDNTKLRIYVSQLQKGKYILRRRST